MLWVLAPILQTVLRKWIIFQGFKEAKPLIEPKDFNFNKERSYKEDTVFAYVYLKNKIFVNAYLIKSGIGEKENENQEAERIIRRDEDEGERACSN